MPNYYKIDLKPHYPSLSDSLGISELHNYCNSYMTDQTHLLIQVLEIDKIDLYTSRVRYNGCILFENDERRNLKYVYSIKSKIINNNFLRDYCTEIEDEEFHRYWILANRGKLESYIWEATKTITKTEVKERIDEFDVIKNSEIDFISLNSLFDFYNLPFDLDKCKQELFC